MSALVRVGAVGYVNAQPLIYGLERRAPQIELTLDYPSVLADSLARDALDVALVPSVEYLRCAADGYRIVPDIAIGARGAVRTVKLFLRVSPGEVSRLALDEGSRTSQVLARVWLAEAHGITPASIEPLPVGASPLESTADAVLVIGDRAMRVPEGAFPLCVDLAEAWNLMTGLPFVFALWAVRPGFEAQGLASILQECRDDGLAHAWELTAECAPRLGVDRTTCYDYFTKVLSYDLGALEVAGLREFAARAAALGLAPRGGELVFVERRHDLAARR